MQLYVNGVGLRRHVGYDVSRSIPTTHSLTSILDGDEWRLLSRRRFGPLEIVTCTRNSLSWSSHSADFSVPASSWMLKCVLKIWDRETGDWIHVT